jgi:Na+-transporting methylmalonyl-CoA/oxaloacetate decarboxylase gamma subunit
MRDLLLSLQITVFGMGLVFAAILLLWLMMVLLTRFTADKVPLSDPDIKQAPLVNENFKRQIAALVVAIALSEQGHSTARPLPDPPTSFVSAWQLGMRTRQMSEKGISRRLKKE